MRVLFLTPQIPYPPHSGGRIVQWNTVKRFAQQCETAVACLYHHPDELGALETMREHGIETAAFPARGKWDWRPALRSAVSKWPYKAHRFFNAALFAHVRGCVSNGGFGVVHAHNFYTTPYVLPGDPLLRVHYKENVEGNILLRYAKTSRNPAVKLAAAMEGLRTRRFETAACRKFHRVLTISPLDRDTLLRLAPGLPVQHQRPGVDLAEYPLLDEPAGPPTAVFTGTLSYYPNADGVRAFLAGCWPLVRRRAPDARCFIVGADPPEAVQAFNGREGVTVTGRVPSVQEFLRMAHAYIVPLRVGGGIRLKILEAMASGRAIATTPVGCEGLEGVHGEHWLSAGMPEAFADAVADLLLNADTRNRLRADARRLAETAYDWDKVISRQVALYREWAEERRGGGMGV